MTKSADKPDDETTPSPGEARLFEMDTREVSLVDHPANKRRLLVVKRDGSEETFDVANQLTVEAPTTKALDQIKKELAGNASEETAKMSQTTNATPGASAGQLPAATTAKAETPAAPTIAPAPVSKIGRPMNGDRLERLKGIQKNFKEALAELRGGQVSLEKFDATAHDLQAIISECDVTKLLEQVRSTKTQKNAVGMAGSDRGGPTPSNPNMGAGVQIDTSEVAGAEAVFGEGVPAQVAELIKSMKGRLDSIEKQNTTLAKKNSALQTEVVSLKKFREAPSLLEEGEADEILSGGEDEDAPSNDEAWPTDMAAARDEELAAAEED